MLSQRYQGRTAPKRSWHNGYPVVMPGERDTAPWTAWTAIFFLVLVYCAIFLRSDCGSVAVFRPHFECGDPPCDIPLLHPLASIVVTLTALASALRAWILARYLG